MYMCVNIVCVHVYLFTSSVVLADAFVFLSLKEVPRRPFFFFCFFFFFLLAVGLGPIAPVPCPPGTFQDEKGQASCKPCVQGFYCPAGDSEPRVTSLLSRLFHLSFTPSCLALLRFLSSPSFLWVEKRDLEKATRQTAVSRSRDLWGLKAVDCFFPLR